MVRPKNTPNVPTAIDLFSGCGGFALGAEAAGVRVVAGFDSYPRCIVTYDHNHRPLGSRPDRRRHKGAKIRFD